jgi:hypothetical protein
LSITAISGVGIVRPLVNEKPSVGSRNALVTQGIAWGDQHGLPGQDQAPATGIGHPLTPQPKLPITVMTWVLVGACIGSLAGFSGVLPAFAGALLGAFIAWQVARRIGPKRPADGREQLLKP